MNENDIENFETKQIQLEEEKHKEKIIEQVSDLAYELAIGSVTKKEFDKMYSNIYANILKINFSDIKIHVKSYLNENKKVIEYTYI